MNRPEIYDAHGRLIQYDTLGLEQGRPHLASVRSIWQPFVAPGLTPQRLASILIQAAQNDPIAFLTLAEEMEEREPHYASVLGIRKRAVTSVFPTVESVSDDPQEEEIAEFIRELLSAPEAGDLIFEMTDALGKGFSAIEIMWDSKADIWRPERYARRDPRFFRFDLATMSEFRLLDARDPSFGIPLDPFKWILHTPRIKSGIPIRGGLARIAAVAYVCKSFTLKDWMSFAEVFGMPVRIGQYNPQLATDNDIALLVDAVANIGTDAAAVIPKTMAIEMHEAISASGGGLLFEKQARYWDEQTSKIVLGQTSSSDAGGGNAVQRAHMNVSADVRDADLTQLAVTLNRDLVRPAVDLNFGRRKKYPRVSLAMKEKEDLAALANALPPFIDRNLPVAISAILKKFGLDEPKAGEALLSPAGARTAATASPTPPSVNSALPVSTEDDIDPLRDEALGGWRRQIDPVVQPIRDLLAQSSNEREFLAGLERLRGQLDASAFQDSLARAMFKAHVNGEEND